MDFRNKTGFHHGEPCHRCRDTSLPAIDWLWLLLALLAVALVVIFGIDA